MNEALPTLASLATAIGVFVAAWQLWLAHRQSITAFEDSFAREYRELAAKLPTKALLGEPLSDDEYAQAFDEFYHYVDLCNEQTFLHIQGRISDATWTFWRDTLPASVVRLDAGNDLAVLKVSGTFTALPVISSRTVKLGEAVSTIGFPNPGLQGFSPKFSTGDISSLTGPQDDPRFFQISIPVQPGNSGGAMVDVRGTVVGVIAAKLGVKAALATSGALPENVNYAVKSSFLMALLESLPAVSARLVEPSTKDRPQEEIAKLLQAATVLVIVE